MTVEAAAEPFVHGGDVCSVSWDFTGTRLVATALDGSVKCVRAAGLCERLASDLMICRLWAANLVGEWGEYSA